MELMNSLKPKSLVSGFFVWEVLHGMTIMILAICAFVSFLISIMIKGMVYLVLSHGRGFVLGMW